MSDGSELRRVERELQRYKKENTAARELLEAVHASCCVLAPLSCSSPTHPQASHVLACVAQQSGRLEVVQQLQNAAAELTHKLEEQEAENALLQKVHARKQQGIAAQGPSELQVQEQQRLRAVTKSTLRVARGRPPHDQAVHTCRAHPGHSRQASVRPCRRVVAD